MVDVKCFIFSIEKKVKFNLYVLKFKANSLKILMIDFGWEILKIFEKKSQLKYFDRIING